MPAARMRFSDARCTIAASQGAQENKQKILIMWIELRSKEAMSHALAGRGGALEQLESVASLPDEDNESGNQSSHDKHPVLAVEAEQVKMSDEKFQRAFSPSPCERIGVSATKIYYFYIRKEAARSMRLRRCVGRGPPGSSLAVQAFGLSWPKRRTKRQQPVEFGRAVADTVRPGDEDLPALFGESASLGDGDDDAQPDGRRGFLTP